jgi:hypothetical protein
MTDGATSTGASAPTEGALKDRLRAAGFSPELGWWREPGGGRLFTLDDAIAALGSGEIQPRYMEWPGTHAGVPVHVRSEEEIDRMLGRNQPPPEEPPPLPSWAAPWAEVIADQLVEKLRPAIRAEVRGVLRAEARKQARES